MRDHPQSIVGAASGLVGLLLAGAAQPTSTAAAGVVDVRYGERLLVVAPHPDDEALGVGGLIRRVVERGGRVAVALMSAGDGYLEAVARETLSASPPPARFIAYGERRLEEVRAALDALGGGRVRLSLLGFPDAELASLLDAHWPADRPARSPTTGCTTVPYGAALEPGAPYTGSEARRLLVRVLRLAAPSIVALPSPLDTHPDHSATGILTLRALDEWRRDAHTVRHLPSPQLLAYLIHWPDWPPGSNAPTPGVEAASDLLLPATYPLHAHVAATLTLSDAEVDAKRVALLRHASQQEHMPAFMAAFVRRTEPYVVLTAGDMRAAALPATAGLPGTPQTAD